MVWETQRNPELLLAALLPDPGRSFTSSPGLHAELGRGALGSTRRYGISPVLGCHLQPSTVKVLLGSKQCWSCPSLLGHCRAAVAVPKGKR